VSQNPAQSQGACLGDCAAAHNINEVDGTGLIKFKYQHVSMKLLRHVY